MTRKLSCLFGPSRALSNLGPAAQKAIPLLNKLTHDVASYEVRHAACLALGLIVSVDKENGPWRPRRP